jgi:hypothetical protein
MWLLLANSASDDCVDGLKPTSSDVTRATGCKHPRLRIPRECPTQIILLDLISVTRLRQIVKLQGAVLRLSPGLKTQHGRLTIHQTPRGSGMSQTFQFSPTSHADRYNKRGTEIPLDNPIIYPYSFLQHYPHRYPYISSLLSWRSRLHHLVFLCSSVLTLRYLHLFEGGKYCCLCCSVKQNIKTIGEIREERDRR